MKTRCPACNTKNIKSNSCNQCQHSWVDVVIESVPNKSKGFFATNHQGKATVYIDALVSRGYEMTNVWDDARFMLTDVDIGARKSQIKRFVDMGGGRRVFLYPHASRPRTHWDGIYRECKDVSAVFTIGAAGVEVPKIYGYSRPIHAVGWPWCEMLPFSANSNPRKVLFAPIHANGNGFLHETQKRTNTETYKRLLPLVKSFEIDLTVRYLHDIEWNGLWDSGCVEFVKGEPDQGYSEIDAADVVVAHQTMAYVAIARGKPTLMMNEHYVPIYSSRPELARYVKSWDKYKHLLVYPLDILANNDTMGMIIRAASSDIEIADWRTRLLGEPFDGDLFVDVLERYL